MTKAQEQRKLADEIQKIGVEAVILPGWAEGNAIRLKASIAGKDAGQAGQSIAADHQEGDHRRHHEDLLALVQAG